MATELAAGYVSLSVRLAKDATKDLTKEVKKAGTEGGKSYSDEFTKKVEKDVGKKLPDTITKSTKKGGGLTKAGKEAADEFGKGLGGELKKGANQAAGEFTGGFLDGMKSGLKKSRVGGTFIEDFAGGLIDDAKKAVKGADFVGVGTSIVKEIADGVDLTAVGTTIVDGLKGALEGGLDEIKGGVRDWAGGIGDDIKSGDIEGAVGEVTDTIRGASRIIGDLGKTFGFDTTKLDADVAHVTNKMDEVARTIQDIPFAGDIIGAGAGIAIEKAMTKGLTSAGLVRAGAGWSIPLTLAAAITYSIIYGEPNNAPPTRTSGQPGQPQLPGTGFNVPGSTTPDFAAGPALPPGTPLPPGFHLDQNGRIVPNRAGGRATGGDINGPGGPKDDRIPIWASNGEHMLTAKDVQAMGGQSGVYAFRNTLHMQGGGRLRRPGPGAGGRMGFPLPELAMLAGKPFLPLPQLPGLLGSGLGTHGRTQFNPNLRLDTSRATVDTGESPLGWLWERIRGTSGFSFAGGGAVGPDVLAAMGYVGTPYSQSSRNDCSGMVARIINATLGMGGGGLMSTKTAQSWLAERGFVPGRGGPGQITVGWYDHGPNPNDGHMAMTLSDGRPAEAGGSHGNFLVGAGAKGADWGKFDQHMYLPTLFGEGPAGSSSVGGAGSTSSGGGSGGGGGRAFTGYGPSGTNETGSNPYAKLAALEKQKQDAIADIFGSQEIGTLGDIGMSGLKETLLPPGFSDPTQWKSTKSVAGLLQAIGTLSGDPQMSSIMGGIGGLMTGQGSAVTGFIPEPFGTMPMPAPAVPGFPGQAGGPGGTGGITIGQYNDQSGKGLQDATRLGAFENSPHTKHLSRIR